MTGIVRTETSLMRAMFGAQAKDMKKFHDLVQMLG